MLKLISAIKIVSKESKTLTFDYANEIEIKTSCRNLTDTATVKVAKKMTWKGKPLTDFIKRDDAITISVGYEQYGIETLFKGYISNIENNAPLTLTAENGMRLLKRISVPAEHIAKFDFKSYMQKYGQGVTVDIADNLSFGSMDISEEMTLAQALDKILETYPYVTGYFQDGVFRARLSTERWSRELRATVFDPRRNMVSDTLKYTLSEDVKIGLKAVSIRRDNTRLEAYSPSAAFSNKTIKSGWEQRQEFCPQCTTQSEVQAYADKRAAEWTTDKMEGTIVAFGVPKVRKGDLIELRDAERKERDGKRFLADAVDYRFGTGGFRQTITLGMRIEN